MDGIYVDVGAFHPTKFSNTHLFYLNGWRGINIEARPGSKKLFDKAGSLRRSGDKSSHLGDVAMRRYVKSDLVAVWRDRHSSVFV